MTLPGSSLPPKDAFQRLIEGLQTFIREHLALAKAEAMDELSALGRDLALAAAGVPFLLTGYLLLMVAAGFALSLLLPAWAAFGIVAVVNLGTGSVLTFVLGRRVLQKRVALPGNDEELERSKQWVAQLKNATDVRPQPALSQAPAHIAKTEVKHG